MMENRYHKGYRVKVTSFRSGPVGARWRTEVVISALRDATASELVLPSPPLGWSASTEEEANQYGFELAKAWIAQTDE